MRYLFVILCVVVLSAGLAFGALNPQVVAIDIHYLSFELRLGVALLLALLLGALLGGLCAALALGLQRRRERQRQRALDDSARMPGPVGDIE
jgi:lipopolysaccharide assembly protein A